MLHHVDYCLGDYNVSRASRRRTTLQQPVMLRHAAAVHAASWVGLLSTPTSTFGSAMAAPASLPDLLERVSARTA